MKRLLPLPLLLLGLSACNVIPQLLGTAASVASGAAGTQDPGVASTPVTPAPAPASTPTNTSSASATPSTTPPPGSKSVTFDTAKKLEYVDIYVDLGDPSGQRVLVPYLMKPEDWFLIKCEMTSITSKHYRFMRVSTADGHSLPQVDIFKQGR